MNERQLRYFAKVVEIGNITRAASTLNVAQPALGQQIRQLEKELGIELLERHSRGTKATEAGQVLYEHAVEILAHFERAEIDVRSIANNIVEVVTVGITHSIMRLVGRDLLQVARHDYDDVRLSLIEEPSLVLINEMEAGHLDLALTYAPTTSAALVQSAVQTEELLFAKRRNTGEPEKGTIALDSLFEHPLVLAGERDPIRRMVDEAAQTAGTQAAIHFEVQSLMATRQTVLSGEAASILPFGVIADEVAQGLVSIYRIDGAPFHRTLYLTRPNRPSRFRNEERVMRWLKSVVKQLAIDLGDLACDTNGVGPETIK